MPLPATSGALVKEVVVAQPTATLSVEKEPPSSGIDKEVRQVVKDAQPIPPFASLVVHDPETFQPSVP